MSPLRRLLGGLLRDEGGSTSLDYSLEAGAWASVVVLGALALRERIITALMTIADTLQAVNG